MCLSQSPLTPRILVMRPKNESQAEPKTNFPKGSCCAFVLRAFLWLSAGAALPRWGWGSGHDDVARLYGAHQPAEIRAFLGDWGGNALTNWRHHPDHFPGHPDQTLALTGAIVGDAYKAAFRNFGYSSGDWLHRHSGRAATRVLLRRAFREGNAKNAAFLLSVLHLVVEGRPVAETACAARQRAGDVDCRRGGEKRLLDARAPLPAFPLLAGPDRGLGGHAARRFRDERAAGRDGRDASPTTAVEDGSRGTRMTRRTTTGRQPRERGALVARELAALQSAYAETCNFGRKLQCSIHIGKRCMYV